MTKTSQQQATEKSDIDKYLDKCNDALVSNRLVPNRLNQVLTELSDISDKILFPKPFADSDGFVSISESEKNYTHLIYLTSEKKGRGIEHEMKIKKVCSRVWKSKKRKHYLATRGNSEIIVLHEGNIN